MEKLTVSMGIGLMIIGISFGMIKLAYPSSGFNFFMTAIVWIVGGVAIILGLFVLSKEEDFLSYK